jgi:hypothetical protein
MEALIELAQRGGDDISVNLTLPGVLALIAGILILVMPRILNYIVAAYLIIVGLVMLFDLKI